MKKLLYILILLPVIGFSQVYQSMPQYGYGPIKRMQFDSVATLPLGLGDLRQSAGFRNIGQVRFNTSDSSLYVWTGFSWAKQAGGGSNVIAGNQLVKSGDTLRMRYQGEGSDTGLHFDPALGSISSGKDNLVTGAGAGAIGEGLRNPVTRSLVVGNSNNPDSSVFNDVKFQVSNGINLFEVRGNGDLKISNSSNFGDVLTDVGGGVYRPQPFQGIRTGDDASLRSLHLTGTNGHGNLLLRHQASPSTATGQTSALFADNNGNLAWHNDNLFRTTFVTNHFNANRNIRFKNRSYTVADSADVALKLNISDTANIRPRLTAGANVTITGSYPNLTIASTGGGGGGTDFPNINVGTSPNVVGNLLNESFPGTSIPAGWTNTSASVTYNNKLIVASGSGSPTNFGQFLQNGFFNYDKQVLSTVIVPQSKTSTSFGVGYTFGQNAQFFSLSSTAYINLTNGADSGRVFVNGVASQNMAFNTGDTIVFSLFVDGWNLTAQAWNKRNNQRVTATQLTSSRLGTGGRFRLCFLGGAQDITNVRVDSWNRIGGLAIIGDSHTSGAGATIEANTYVSRLVNGDLSRVANYGYPSITGGNVGGFSWILSAWQNLKRQQPTQAVIAIGYNDATNVDTATFRVGYRAIIDSLLSINVRPILTTLVPRFANSPINTPNYNIVINSLGAQYGLKVANVFGAMVTGANLIVPNYLSSDLVHITDSGHAVMASTIRSVAPEIFSQFVPDTTSNVVFNNIPVGASNDELLAIDTRGRVRKVANTMPTTETVIQNIRTFDPTYLQQASIGVTGNIRGGGTLQISDSTGLRIGFNGGIRGQALTSGSNINITNMGTPGSGSPQFFNRISGLRNILVNALSDKANGSLTITGNDNTLLSYVGRNVDTLSGSQNVVIGFPNGRLTTGTANIGIGARALSLTTTGSYNIDLTGIVDYSNAGANIGNNTGRIVIGTPYDFTGTEAISDGEVVISSYTRGNRTYTFGAKGGYNRNILWRAGYEGGTNINGSALTIQSARGTGTGSGGNIVFQISNPGTTGTTVNSTFTTALTLSRVAATTALQIDNSTATRGILPARWTTAARPASPALGELGYNTTDNKLEYWNGTTWVQF